MAGPKTFFANPGTHVLMITNHGMHEWSVVPGLPDTGGQNVYVNQFTEALIHRGYRVTIVNRGGYEHPVTGQQQTGAVYHPTGLARILYIEDDVRAFVRKEDMGDHIDQLVGDLQERLAADDIGYDLIISHYWDGGLLGAELNDRADRRVPHIWVPHSVGALKKRNMDATTWESLRIDERIASETDLVRRVDGTVATSSAIAASLRSDYGHDPRYFLPPCIDVDRFHPRSASECEGFWEFLEMNSPLDLDELRSRRIVTEVSRTDHTKRKNILIEAFARALRRAPDLLLAVTLDPQAGAAYDEAMSLITDLDIARDVVVLGSVWDRLPCLYAASSVYCTPSVMEGFGMSAQEAAATAVPVVASNLVPFAYEYLVGAGPEHRSINGSPMHHKLLIGKGAVVVPADDVQGFAEALLYVLADEDRRVEMGRHALDITVPYFTWDRRTEELMADLGVAPHAT